jgi:hypothetical protein
MSTPLPGLHLQTPSVPGVTLLDAMALAAEGATSAGGVFAFATERGARAVLGDGGPFAAVGEVELVVGLDAITDVRAIDAITELTTDRPGVRARALLNPEARLFHPKLSWFRTPTTTALFVGSGNLTPGGLVGNHEAFFAAVLTGTDADAAIAQITSWLEALEPALRPLDDAEVRKAAKANSGAERSLRKKMPTEDEEEPESVDSGAEDVLIFEVSKNTEDGRTQLDVGRPAWRDFFGGVEGLRKQVLVQPVGLDGSVGKLEPPRGLGNTKSTNFRVEVGARRNMAHPPAGQRPRPIGVFRRMADGAYRYVLVWPGESGHAALTTYLDSVESPPGRTMRRPITTVATLRSAWPGCPLL